MESTTNIYFIGNVELGAVKIGISKNPEKRLVEIQTGNSHKLVLYGIIQDVKEDYEKKLHQIYDHLRLEGEWFKLTDELIHFIVNKTNKVNEFKTDTPKLIKINDDPLDEIVNKIVEYNENGRDFLKESHLVDIIRRYLIFKSESTNFDIKKLKRIMESKGIYRTRENGEWGYSGHSANEKNLYPDHYIRSTSTLHSNVVKEWNKIWEKWMESEDYNEFKISQGYSIITKYENDTPILYTITTTLHGFEHKVVIYKGGIYDARGLIEYIN